MVGASAARAVTAAAAAGCLLLLPVSARDVGLRVRQGPGSGGPGGGPGGSGPGGAGPGGPGLGGSGPGSPAGNPPGGPGRGGPGLGAGGRVGPGGPPGIAPNTPPSQPPGGPPGGAPAQILPPVNPISNIAPPNSVPLATAPNVPNSSPDAGRESQPPSSPAAERLLPTSIVMNAAESPGGISFATLSEIPTPIATLDPLILTSSIPPLISTLDPPIVSDPVLPSPTSSSPGLGYSEDVPGTTTPVSPPTNSSPPPTEPTDGSDGSDGAMNRTMVITLSTVLTIVFLLLAAVIFFAFRYRQKRFPFRPRGSSPIDDDEIQTWRVSGAPPEKGGGYGAMAWTTVTAGGGSSPHSHHKRHPSSKSVIVYRNMDPQPPRVSSEYTERTIISPTASRTVGLSGYGRASLDKEVGSPVLARAPNAREGLTDEAIPGDPSFITSPKRAAARLSKPPPTPGGRSRHSRTYSSRSSTSIRSMVYGGSAMEFQVSPRESSDFPSSVYGRSRVYSTSSVPPRLSLGDDFMAGGLSPRPLLRDSIGRGMR